MSTTQFLTPINPVKMAMTSSMLSSFEVLHSFVYDVIKPLFPKQPYLSRTIRNALSLALGYKSYSDLVDSARRNMVVSDGGGFLFKAHEDAVELFLCHLAEKLQLHQKRDGAVELEDLRSILDNESVYFSVREGKSLALSLTLKNNEIVSASYIDDLYEMDDFELFKTSIFQLYHHFMEWGYQPYLEKMGFRLFDEIIAAINLEAGIANDISKFKEDSALDIQSKNELARRIDAQMVKVFTQNGFFYDQQSFTPFSIKTHFYDFSGDWFYISHLYCVNKRFQEFKQNRR